MTSFSIFDLALSHVLDTKDNSQSFEIKHTDAGDALKLYHIQQKKLIEFLWLVKNAS